jgi:hypothetical protein
MTKKVSSITNKDLGLSSVIGQIRSELISLDQERRSSRGSPLFEIDEVSIELKFIVRTDDSGRWKFDLKVISYEDLTDLATEKVHTITVKMKTLKSNSTVDISSPLGSLATIE